MVTKLYTWPEYVRLHTNGLSNKDIAEALDVAPSTVGRWFKGTRPQADHVSRFASVFNAWPAEALAVAGFIPMVDDPLLKAYLDQPRKTDIRLFTDLELAREMLRRIEEAGSAILEEPLDGHHPVFEDNVSAFPLNGVAGEADDFDAVAKGEETVIEIDEFDDGV